MTGAQETIELLQQSVDLTVHLDRENQLKGKVLEWVANGRVGLSSGVMAVAACGVKPKMPIHPSDPDDLARCLMLLVRVPEIRDRLDRVAALSETWAALVERWDEVEACFRDEVGLNWSHGDRAPKTYELMKAIGC